MPFQPGVAANPNGRPVGSRNPRTEEIWSRLEARGDLDPADVLSEMVSDKTLAKELRATAANYLLPYKYGKRGVIPVARFIPEQIEVPNFQTIQQAEDYLASIPVLLGRSELDSQTALELSTLTKNWLDAIYAHQEYDLKVQAQGGGPDTTIRIEGGMPQLPGTNIIGMEQYPTVNGHTAINGHGAGPVIDHQEPPALTESVPSEGQEP
jgi:hypothetical protein